MTIDQGLAGHPELYRQCFRDSNDAIAITDARGIIIAVNPAFEALYGYSADEVLGRTTAVIKSTNTSRGMYDEMWADIRDPAKGFWKGEIINCRKDGSEVPVLLSITPIRDAGSLIGYMGIAIDLTERKKLEQLKDLYDKVMRHDLKAPLGAIVALSEGLLSGDLPLSGDEARHCLERIRRRAEELLEVINTSLDLDKIARGSWRAEVEPVEVAGLLAEACATLAHLAETRNVRFRLVLDPRAVGAERQLPLMLDRIYLRRACENLVKNSLEAAPPQSEVTVTLTAGEGEYLVHFANGGPPIPESVRATLFHPFSTFGKRGGTGLGLTGVKMVVEAMGGRVSYVTGAAGTTFSLHFPFSLRQR